MKVIITGGGTGGHYYPASLIADKLIRENHEVYYFGNKDFIEKIECEKKKVPFFHIPSKNTLKKDLKFMVENTKGIFKAIFLLKKLNPNVVYSTGGFTTAPVVAAATILRIPVVLHEQNAVVGLVQRIFRKKAKSFIHSYPFDIRKEERLIGNLSRYNIDLERNSNYIVLMGGSGGAKFINDLSFELANSMPNKNFLLISGKNYEVKEQIDNLKILNYVEDMEEVYKQSDLVIARAGSTTLSELSSLGIPSIIIPMPNSADNHQVKNAEFYASKGAVIKLEQNEDTTDQLNLIIKSLSETKKRKIATTFKKCYNKEAENQVIEEIKKVALS